MNRHTQRSTEEATMTTKTIDVARELMRLYEGIPDDEENPAVYRGVITTLRSKFPDVTNDEISHAHDVLLDQVDMVMEDTKERCARVKSIIGAAAQLEGTHPGSVAAAVKLGTAELARMKREGFTPDSIFPMRPDKSKS
jgi:hypothetical protein